MPKLYVMNTTIRHHEIAWRWAADSSYRKEMIAAGQQVVVGGPDLTMGMIEQIVKQNEKYGMRAASSISREKGFIGLVYSVDKPVDLKAIDTVIERNEHELAADATDRREATAAAIAENISQMTGKEVKRMEVEQTETGTVNAPDSKSNDASAASMGTELVREDVEPRHRGKQSPRAQERSQN